MPRFSLAGQRAKRGSSATLMPQHVGRRGGKSVARPGSNCAAAHSCGTGTTSTRLHPRPQQATKSHARAGAASMPIGVPQQPKRYWVYITTNVPRGVLYVGMTSDLTRRAWEHQNKLLEGFTRRYGADRLVYFEEHPDAAAAARRERAMKRWRRDWKIELVEKCNPTWRDLCADVMREFGFES